MQGPSAARPSLMECKAEAGSTSVAGDGQLELPAALNALALPVGCDGDDDDDDMGDRDRDPLFDELFGDSAEEEALVMEELEQELAVDRVKQIAKPSTAEAMPVCPELMVASGALPSCAGAGAVTMRSDGPRGSSSQHASFPAHARRARWGVHGDLVGVKSEVEETAPSTSTPRKAAASPAAKFKQRIDGAETHPVMSPASAKSSVSRSSSVCPLTSPSSKHESGGGQSGLASAAAPRRHQDDDDDALDESLPVNKFSLAEKLPAGQACAPLTRIRATVNSYVDRVVSPAWLASFKLPTVKALQRRLLQHESSIIGNFHTDLEISYRQLVGRIGALIDLHKSLVACNESQKLGRISEIVGPMTVLNKYLEATEQHMAPDLSIIHMFALVQHDLKKNRPVADALSHVDVAQLARWQDELRQKAAMKTRAMRSRSTLQFSRGHGLLH